MRKILDNGLTIRTCSLEKTNAVCLILKLRIGAAWEKKNRRGITHLVEHLCFRRNRGMEQADFYYEIEKIGGHLRGVTYRDCVMFEITVLKKHLYAAVAILRGMFDDNGWTHEDIRREKQVVLRQLENSGEWKHKQLMYDFFCKEPAGDCVLGTENKVMSCTRNDIIAWKNILFNANYAEIIATGNIADADVTYIADAFSDIPKSDLIVLPEIKPVRFLNRNARDEYYYEQEDGTTALSLAFDIDTTRVRRQAADILHSSLCRGLLSPFTMRLREELGLIDEIESGCLFYDFGGVMYFLMGVSSEKTELFLKTVKSLLSEQCKSLDVRSFECAKAAFTDRAEALLFTPNEFAYILAFDDKISSTEEYLSANRDIEYGEACESAEEILKKKNVTVNVYS